MGSNSAGGADGVTGAKLWLSEPIETEILDWYQLINQPTYLPTYLLKNDARATSEKLFIRQQTRVVYE